MRWGRIISRFQSYICAIRFPGDSLWVFVVLPCGLSPNPMMFVRCTEAAVGTTQQKDIWVAAHIKNWLLPAPTCQQEENLDFQINVEQSVLRPTEHINFTALRLDALQWRLSPDRLVTMQSTIALCCRAALLPSDSARGCWAWWIPL